MPRYLTQAAQEYPRQTQLSGCSPSPILKKIQALLPGLLFISFKIIIPYASAVAALPVEVISGQPKLPQGWLNWEQLQSFPPNWISLQGALSDPHSSPVVTLSCDFTHSFLLEKQVNCHRK